MKSYKKKYRLLLLRKEKKKEIPLEINKQEIERNVSKSWFDRTTRNSPSIMNYSYQQFNITKCNKDKKILTQRSNQKSSHQLKLKYKILFERENEKPIQLKYLNNENLDELFSKKIINTDNNNLIIPNSILDKINILKNNKKKSTNYTKISNYSSNLDDKHLNENNKYKYFLNLLKNSDKEIRKVSLSRYSLAGRLALQTVNNLDVIEENSDFSKFMKPQSKFAKFKLLLNKQKNKTVKIIQEVHDHRIKNEQILKGYLYRLLKKSKI